MARGVPDEEFEIQETTGRLYVMVQWIEGDEGNEDERVALVLPILGIHEHDYESCNSSAGWSSLC
jgi:hypothetical protein